MTSLGSVAHRIFGLFAAAVLTVILLYVSRFWIWRAPWGNDGLFGLRIFPPGGDAVTRWVNNLNRFVNQVKDTYWQWLKEIPFPELSLIIWGCGAIIFLSLLHWVASRVIRTR
ncbi:MAG: hypothetical protein AAFR90_05790 [Pseudomonadota bacterium]